MDLRAAPMPPDMVFTLEGVRAAYAGGASPQEVVRTVYRRIEAVGDPGIFIHLAPEAEVASAAAAAHAKGGPLAGIPFAVKDNIDVAGMPTTAACPAFAYMPDEDAFVVARLKALGGVVVGKTNLDQFATGLVGVRTPYPVPRNAISPALVPGGSSSGSAVAVAHGIVPFALGTDTAGSGRVPAALNNIVGVKPTLGTLSARGVVPACRTLDTISVFALTVADAVEIARAATAFDAADPYSRQVPPLPAHLTHPVVAIPDGPTADLFDDADQAESFAATVEALAADGATIRPMDFSDFFAAARLLYEGAFLAERLIAAGPLMERDPDALYPVTRAVIAPAREQSAADAFRARYALAELRRAVEPILADADLLCVPSVPGLATLDAVAADPIGANARLGAYTNFVNLLDFSGLTVPTASRSDGLPGSVTLLAKAGGDARLATVGARLEHLGARTLGATLWPVPAPRPPEPIGAQPDETELAVCGAHMSGMALNHQLSHRGGRLLRTVRTEPVYRFYKLPGRPPRPGLVRVSEGGGAIDVEVWALPQSAVGAFLAEIPAPLGLGTVRLADGTSPKGFLCEAAAVSDAAEVTHLGSWRTVMAQADEDEPGDPAARKSEPASAL